MERLGRKRRNQWGLDSATVSTRTESDQLVYVIISSSTCSTWAGFVGHEELLFASNGTMRALFRLLPSPC